MGTSGRGREDARIGFGRKATAATAALMAACAIGPGHAYASVAGEECTHRAADGAAPLGGTPCPGVRPGAFAVLGNPPVLDGTVPDGYCTLGFMVRGGGHRFMMTAGHCAGLDEGDEETWEPGEGQPVWDAEGNRIGEFAYAAVAEGGLSRDGDLALIRLDRGVQAKPQVCHFGGPVGINTDILPVTTPVTLEFYGATLAGGFVPVAERWALPARSGVANGLPNARRVSFAGHASFGDSGGPVLSADGRAVGLISGPAAADADGHAGTVNAPRLAHQIRRAEARLGHRLQLAEAPTS